MMPSIAPNSLTIDYTSYGRTHSLTGLLWVVWNMPCPAQGTWQGYASLPLHDGGLPADRLGDLPAIVQVALFDRVRQIRHRADEAASDGRA